MSSQAPYEGNRYFCGRIHRRPWWVVLMNWLGWHQEWVRQRLPSKPGSDKPVYADPARRWRFSNNPTQDLYTCRKRMDHWKVTIKPQGERMVLQIHDRNFSQPAQDEADRKNVRNRRTPYWRGRLMKPTREENVIPYPTEAWELGHRYQYTRTEFL